MGLGDVLCCVQKQGSGCILPYFAAEIALSVQWVPFWPHNWGKKTNFALWNGELLSECLCSLLPCEDSSVLSTVSAVKCRSSLVFPCAAGLPGAWKCPARSKRRQQRRKYLLVHSGYFGTGLELLGNIVYSEIFLLQRKVLRKIVVVWYVHCSSVAESVPWVLHKFVPKFWGKTCCVLCSAKLWDL